MMTEVDIERIMAATVQLSESVAVEPDCNMIDDIELIELHEEEIPVSETNGLI